MLINEMKKCDLRCSNCHAIKTFLNKEGGSQAWKPNADAKRKERSKLIRSKELDENIDKNEVSYENETSVKMYIR